jgi:uncharacterized protein (DUF885 family)
VQDLPNRLHPEETVMRRTRFAVCCFALCALALGRPGAAEPPASPDAQASGGGHGAAALTPSMSAAAAHQFAYALNGVIASRGQKTDTVRLTALFAAYWDFQLADSPELATAIGHPGFNGRWSDLSPAAYAHRRELAAQVVEAAESIDATRLVPAEQVNYDLFLRRVRLEKEGAGFPAELMQISQLSGVQQFVPDLLSTTPARTLADYEDLLSRLHGVPRLIDQTLALLQSGLAAGVTPPRITLRDVPGQVSALLVDDPAASPMLEAFKSFPATFSQADGERLRRAAHAAYRDEVKPAFTKLRDYLVSTYVPHARESIAMSALPNGAAWYAYNVKVTTTTDRTPAQIHELGLAEVKRIRAAMDQLIASTGFTGGFADFQKFLRTDPRFFFDRPEDLLVAYRDICKRIDPELIKIFGKLPRLPYGVLPVPAYSEKSQTTAYYSGGSLAAGKAGTFYANTYDLKSRPKWEMEALTLHEAVPGHHLQLSLAEEVEGVPAWRRYDFYTAYVEGWGLYAESLGGELGLYKDPYSKFGQLTYEVWRAIRLVVDTGIHAMGWSREQAIEYFKANAAKTDHDITVEVDRYIVSPGQALAYKLGELKIKELRADAERRLGAHFDERAFHDAVLAKGAMPLDVLDRRMRAWTEEQAVHLTPAAPRGAAAPATP